MRKNFCTFALTVIIAVVTLLICSCGNTTIDFSDYVDVTFEKYDGYGNATFDIDWNSIGEKIDRDTDLNYVWDNIDRLGIGAMSRDEFDQAIGSNLTGYFIYPEFSSDLSNLSNGDKVSISFKLGYQFQTKGFTFEEVEKGLGVEFKNTELEFKVKGLEKVKKAKIDAEQFINVDFGLYNGYATPAVTVSEAMFAEVIPDLWKAYKEDSSNSAHSIMRRYENIQDFFSIDFAEEYANVSNGDKLKVEIKPSPKLEENGVTLKDLEEGLMLDFKKTEFTYNVSGLEEAKNVINVFEEIDKYIHYEGANGFGQLYNLELGDDYSPVYGELYFKPSDFGDEIKVIYNNKNICEIEFNFDNAKNLKEGDKVAITAHFSDRQAMEKLGYIIASEKGYVTVPNLGNYLTSTDQITHEVIESLKAEITVKSNPAEICEIYYATYNPGVECNYKSTSFIVPIVRKSGWFSSGYYIDEAYDVIIKPDGSVMTNYDVGSYGAKADTLDGVLKLLDYDSYSFEKIFSNDADS